MMLLVEDRTEEVQFSGEDTFPHAASTLEDIQREMVILERYGYTPMGTFGRLHYRDLHCYTVEKQWEHNQPFISCIPVGIYKLETTIFYGGDGPGGKRDYPTYKLLSVPNRSQIKIHVANTSDDLMGCIGLGTQLGSLSKRWAVLESKLALRRFLDEMAVRPAPYICIKNLAGQGEYLDPGGQSCL